MDRLPDSRHSMHSQGWLVARYPYECAEAKIPAGWGIYNRKVSENRHGCSNREVIWKKRRLGKCLKRSIYSEVTLRWQKIS
jgi:hypothetical protein